MRALVVGTVGTAVTWFLNLLNQVPWAGLTGLLTAVYLAVKIYFLIRNRGK